jgi:hypothetical protein
VLRDDSATPRDALATAEYWSSEDRMRNRAAAGYHAIMRADELEVFDRAIVECSFIHTHHVLVGSGTGPFKIVRFVRRIGDAATFADEWMRWADWLLDRPAGVSGYAVNPALPAPTGGWGMDVDGSDEFWFDDLDKATAFLDSGVLARRTASAPFVVADAVVTNEVILKDAR